MTDNNCTCGTDEYCDYCKSKARSQNDTAKPTYAFFDNTNKNTEFLFKQDGLPDVRVSSELVHELALVTAQTNLTPRQLLEQRDELLHALEGFIKSFHESVITDDPKQFPAMADGIAAMNKARGVPAGYSRTFVARHPNWPDGIWQIRADVAALAKHGEGV